MRGPELLQCITTAEVNSVKPLRPRPRSRLRQHAFGKVHGNEITRLPESVRKEHRGEPGAAPGFEYALVPGQHKPGDKAFHRFAGFFYPELVIELVDAVVRIAEPFLVDLSPRFVPYREETWYTMPPGQVFPAEGGRLIGREGQLRGVYVRGERAPHAAGPGLPEMLPHAVKNGVERLPGDVAEGKRHQVAGADFAAAVNVKVRKAGAATERFR
ncbi:MAG: hypothetical protein BWY06_02959 [Candidatus Latescibacteria bacterium ADurb.Bin168]|nr:MAG: hypothetical protein BWY06_02959 [Candidatus Latescibacteria bacterium ADurb.Bin168]